MSRIIPFLLLAGLSFGCARSDFFQKTALTDPLEKEAISAGKIPDSVSVTIGRHYDKNRLQTIFFGKHYRKLWATPVRIPVYNSPNKKTGLIPVSLGGGFQTTSLTLKNPSGKLYVLRSLDKDPQKTLPVGLRNTFLVNILRDQTSAANPFAPLVLPQLSEAAGIFYSSPKLVYVTENDSSFGKFSDRLQGKVMLLEEKFDGKQSLNPIFGDAVNLVGSEKLLTERFEDNRHLIDQSLFARSRLFDVLIGDWDRHEGQWQWAVLKKGKETIYKPIPKDRDQTFYRFNDGIITWLASKTPILKKFQTFHKNYGNLSGWLFNARFIDARALNEVSKEEWLRHAEEIKTAITDEVITQAFSNLPKPIYSQTGPETISKLKSRLELLPETAGKIYLMLAEEVTIPGSDKEEKFVVNRLTSGETQVEVFRTEGNDPQPFYSRTFKPKETKKIILHGLGGNDEFKISGEAKRAISLDVFGGEGEDELIDASIIGGFGKPTTVYDTNRGIIIDRKKELNKKLSRDVSIHAFDREGL